MKRKTTVVLCPYDSQLAELVHRSEIYGKRPSFKKASRYLWLCRACGAYVGCHKGTDVPLGTLANAETRLARIKAHAVFDDRWRELAAHYKINHKYARKRAYRWLAEQLSLTEDECHIGLFTAEQCQQVIDICLTPSIIAI